MAARRPHDDASWRATGDLGQGAHPGPPLKIARLIALGAFGLLAGLAAVALCSRAWLQHVAAERAAIHSSKGIDVGLYVKVGGVDQWVRIRGQDRDGPVLLCLNGGPGASWVPLTLWFMDWEKDFTVVQWDQRGEGKSLEATGPAVADTMSIPTMARDGIEVAEYLRGRLHRDRVVLLGHSWGSILGIHMIRQRPDLFSAYVGTGQVGNLSRSLQMAYRRTLEKARAAGDLKAVGSLERIGPPPYSEKEFPKLPVLFGWLGAYAPESDRAALASLLPTLLTAPDYSLRDIYYRNLGFVSVPTPGFYHAMLSEDLPGLGTDFKVPLYFFQGMDDDITLASLAREYFDVIQAPRKEFVDFEGGGHFVVWSMRDRFLHELVTRVRPLDAG